MIMSAKVLGKRVVEKYGVLEVGDVEEFGRYQVIVGLEDARKVEVGQECVIRVKEVSVSGSRVLLRGFLV